MIGLIYKRAGKTAQDWHPARTELRGDGPPRNHDSATLRFRQGEATELSTGYVIFLRDHLHVIAEFG